MEGAVEDSWVGTRVMEQRQKIILWDRDIVWNESFKVRLLKNEIFCEEVDSREELYELLGQSREYSLCILSWETIQESGMVLENIFDDIQGKFQVPVILGMETDEIEAELQALRSGAVEVFFKEREVEIATERVMQCFRRMANESSVRPTEKQMPLSSFETEFEDIAFTVMEKKVLYEMYSNLGQVVSRKQFLHRFWSGRSEEENRVVDTVVKQLRKKIKNTAYRIKSIYGIGYLLEK